ncbi:activating signal cointegrator 1 complex subunit [Gaertneriomyces sp. JEL0708]|nr:activating signal cointegrator 1 complex subunit [Gaertneriomyces sp. JEL0708]
MTGSTSFTPTGVSSFSEILRTFMSTSLAVHNAYDSDGDGHSSDYEATPQGGRHSLMFADEAQYQPDELIGDIYGGYEELLSDIETLLAEDSGPSDGLYMDRPEFGADIVFDVPTSFAAVNGISQDSDVDTVLDDQDGIVRPRGGESLDIDSRIYGDVVIPVEKPFGREWLLDQCSTHLANFARDSILAPEQLTTDVFAILRSEKNDDDIQISLVDLLGYENFDLITLLITHRKEILDTIAEQAAEEELRSQPAPALPPRSRGRDQVPSYDRAPIHGATVTVMSETEKVQVKQRKKEWKRRAKETVEESDTLKTAALLGLDGERLRRAREEQLLAAANAPLTSNPSVGTAQQETYPNVYQSGSGGSTLSIFGSRFALPQGTEREDYQNYEEISIPVAKPHPVRASERCMNIDELDPIAQKAFKNYQSLNRVQSIVFPVAYGTNENMLVCAPTGAGKTDIAMLTVLRCISQFIEGNTIKRNEFKIVYVAPMKALASEIVRKFGGRLGPLGLNVRELTGDMQLTKAELASTQMIVTTPEKWDVVTRKSVGDTELAQKVRLLIIDEVHLLHEDRGAVIESLVARTLRQVESSQSMIRIVGLSATLPNYVDVASFLGVNPYAGLFFFDSAFRPVPLEQHFVGVKGKGNIVRRRMDEICYDKVSEMVRDGAQVMVFVNARKDTVKTAETLREEAGQRNELGFFDMSEHEQYTIAVKEMQRSKNREMKELFKYGFGIHHAGMLRSDRHMVERFFEKGLIRVLCCTATLAWGVNLPAYAVVIKGTQLYDANKGGFVDLSILDVMQIFGRAGRPQYEDRGVGYILTTHDKLQHYVSSMTQQHPIESTFAQRLADHLNAEIALGTVTTVDEGIRWLSYTYLYTRMRRNPFQYGLNWTDVQKDPLLHQRRHDLIHATAKLLRDTQMIGYDERTGFLTPKDLGRIASGFYVTRGTVEGVNKTLRARMNEADVLGVLCAAEEFEGVKIRDEEVPELKKLMNEWGVCDVKGGTDTNYGKCNILLQAHISRAQIEDFALVSDTAYVAQNAARILRALFQIALSRNWGPVALVLLSLCKAVDRRLWTFEHPLRQFDISYEIMDKLESRENIGVDELRDMSLAEIGELIRHRKMAGLVKGCAERFPRVELEVDIKPITGSVLRCEVQVWGDWLYSDKEGPESWWVWVEGPEGEEILYNEMIRIGKKEMDEGVKLGFTIPVPKTEDGGVAPQVYVRAISDRWIGAETVVPVSFKHLILPKMNRTAHTELLPLQPLPVSALQDPVAETICRQRFEYFNPVQTQIFHTLYRTNHNVLVGAPTGSGKTVAAELALWACFRDFPKGKVVYIAPLKALVRERVKDWRDRLCGLMGRKLVELTGDVTPDLRTLESADIIITTPEKWDGISRGWRTRKYVTDVKLLIIDEIHLLGGDRGPILEVIVSRMNFISVQMKREKGVDAGVRIVGLSTALANAGDLADWLGIEHGVGLFNFRHSVRPVPLEVYIDGVAGKHYCPRMQSMNKPTFSAILTHSMDKPVIVFVSSRRQTRLTAGDLMRLCANTERPKMWVKMPEYEVESIVDMVKDQSLKEALGFGIGLHHAGLVEGDRRIVEELFVEGKIQVLIATSTLAWGVNFPAHLVVIKGTEYYDAKTRSYVDFPITDVLQMMGRAGRPQFDDSGVARIFVQDTKKNFYKRFLHESFPVESWLHLSVEDHLMAEVVGGTIKSGQDAVEWLGWTYLFRRVGMNPTYYGIEDSTPEGVNLWISGLIKKALHTLAEAKCIEIEGDFYLTPTVYGKIASYYYLHYATIRMLTQRLGPGYRQAKDSKSCGDFPALMQVLCDVSEYDELPVRHNEDKMCAKMEDDCLFAINRMNDGSRFAEPKSYTYEDPHAKAFLLIQAHLGGWKQMPCSDFWTDMTSVLDQSIRIMQAMVDVCSEGGWLGSSLGVMELVKCLKSGCWPWDGEVAGLFGVKDDKDLKLKDILNMDRSKQEATLRRLGVGIPEGLRVLANVPTVEISASIAGAIEKLPGLWGIEAGKEYDVKITLSRKRPYQATPKAQKYRAYTPKFAKPQYEGWWVLVGDEVEDEVVAVKRVAPSALVGNQRRNGGDKLTCNIKFIAPDESGEVDLTVWVVSDCYRGVDERLRMRLLVK